MSYNNNVDSREAIRRLSKISPHSLFLDMTPIPYSYHHNVHPYQQYLLQNVPTTRQHQCEPLDLRRPDSVETRQTTSPYNISSNDETSPTRNKSHQQNIQPTTPDALSRTTSTQLPIYMQYSPITNFVTKKESISPTSMTENDHHQCSSLSPPPPPPPPLQKNQSTSLVTSTPIQQNISSSNRSTSSNLAIENLNAFQQERLNTLQLAQLAMHREMSRASSSLSSSISPESVSSLVSLPAGITVTPPIGNNGVSIPLLVGRDGKIPRPFKIYPKNPLNLTATFGNNDSIINRKSEEDYKAYRGEMIEKIYKENGGFPTKTNPKMRRISTKNPQSSSISSILNDIDDQKNNNSNSDLNDSDNLTTKKDEAYYERRKKNNAAAKKSRDRRRVKEDDLAIRTAFLEGENFRLRMQLQASQSREKLLQQTAAKLETQINQILHNNHHHNDK